MKGILYGVGVGPGDPELLTAKAIWLLRECDAVSYTHLDVYKRQILYPSIPGFVKCGKAGVLLCMQRLLPADC